VRYLHQRWDATERVNAHREGSGQVGVGPRCTRRCATRLDRLVRENRLLEMACSHFVLASVADSLCRSCLGMCP
jgi:hypothetical protein